MTEGPDPEWEIYRSERALLAKIAGKAKQRTRAAEKRLKKAEEALEKARQELEVASWEEIDAVSKQQLYEKTRPGYILKGLPILGKIRLGCRTERQGDETEETTPRFVLTDAHGAAAVYGEDPKELDVFFPADERYEVWFRNYGANLKNNENES